MKETRLQVKSYENAENMVLMSQYENVLRIEHTVLEMMAQRKSHDEILNKVCEMAEALLPNAVATIMLKEEKSGVLNLAYAPSIPKSSWHFLENLKPGPHAGSCGSAVYSEEPQYVTDTFNDIRWLDLKGVAESFNLCSCWSVPVKDADKKVIGSFALSSFEHREPTKFHKMLLEAGAHIISIVLTKMQGENRLKILQQAMHSANEGIIFTDEANNIIEVNNTFEAIYGYTQNEVVGKNPKILNSGVQKESFYTKMWQQIVSEGHWSGEIVNKNKKGELVEQWMSINTIDDPSMGAKYFAIFTDIRELKRAQKLNRYLIYHDQLTDLMNKVKLQEMLKESTDYAIVHADINNFSYINMAYGFEFGDKLLREIAKVLSSEFDAEAVFRVNSDEFVLLFSPNVELEHILMDMQRYFYDNPYIIEDVVMNISLNYGAAYAGKNLLENAAFSLKVSKEKGKNRFHIFDEETDKPSKEKKNSFIEASALLYTAMENDLFRTFIQGIYDNREKKITKYEVLVRIEKEDGTIVTPYQFLEAAQLSGMLPEITKKVIDRSFALMQDLQEEFSINITEDDLNRNYLAHYLQNRLQKYNIPPQRVILEILEGVSVSGKSNNIEQLKQLKQLGIRLAIDDFGAEYSNFERLLELDVDFLKIDAKYIKNIDKDTKSYEIVKAISAFAKKLNIECVAEFVHNADVQKKIEELEIEYSQGYFFDKPHLPKFKE